MTNEFEKLCNRKLYKKEKPYSLLSVFPNLLPKLYRYLGSRADAGRPGGRALLPAAQSHSRETLPKRRGRKRHKGGDPAGLSEGRTVHAEEPRPRPGDAFDSEPSPRTRGASGHPAGRAPPGRDPLPTPLRNKGQEGPRGGGGDAVSSTAAFGLWKVARTCRTG